uniref:Uncharacterized protein n=1 Tax=Chaetoceros debilis TaxID=122233 RepID=A0A6S8TYM2_9STRA|mmetsp:Transcript_9453/g.14168  ORF Transcript_9453/g.14168 Transcript_9453/m.14168 type:complete len:173 (-) Transcript_9453:1278-1796(-)
MLPILVLTVPPVVGGGGYVCWSQGQNFILNSMGSAGNGKGNAGQSTSSMVLLTSTSNAPDQSIGSFAAGIVTLFGSYNLAFTGLAAAILPKKELSSVSAPAKPSTSTGAGASNSTSGNKKSIKKFQQNYKPPQSMQEFFQKAGRPGLVRVGAAGFAFFCAGAAQTIVALKFS